MKNPKGFSTLLTIFGISALYATSFQSIASVSLDDLRLQVRQYIVNQLEESPETRWEVEVRGLDPRIRLDDCPQPVSFRMTGKRQTIGRQNTIHASCVSESSDTLWSLYIPTQVKRMEPAIITKSAVQAGTILEDDDIAIEYRDAFALRGAHYNNFEQIVGARVKHSISPGQVIRSRNLCQVCKGEQIIIEAVGQGLVLKTEGTALSDGIVGQAVRVENKRSGRKISAVVSATGRVQVKI
ncbi:flagellar basal body P-ring formation chaperone FlgA [Echinimonas agarilytica]|uniref:Flagella basal body P-ring formation protein FlgA n=1 Tax=Echinimonas agarilytica TaxID=1215918 RepID=A0AA41W5J3_9GAMM|nr:flagellar basal body P-ring formation chaperone FlgA [Echinimonas agarilytica]MCM2678932.1 flagellar basal body P-ring formation protein FlgA [Echinimonas agarilytica]